MIVVLTDKVLAQLRTAGLALPKSPYPGQAWAPRTDAEQHLLRESRRLDRLRQLLLEEVGRLRKEAGHKPRREVIAAAAHTAGRLKDCPLSPQERAIIAAAAAGESPQETARRLCLAYDTVKSHRQRALSRLEARSVPHAVALAVAAGWVSARQVTEGVVAP